MANAPKLQSLRELILSGYPRELLEKQFEEFSCSRDSDVESFMHSKVIDYELSGLSRTYLYQLDDALPDGSPDIAAYFSLALTSVSFLGISDKKRQKVLGGKVAYLDCRQPLISYYQKYGFKLVSETASESGLHKMFKVLPKLAWS